MQASKRKGFSPKCGFSRVAADGDFLHNMIRKAAEGKDINHKGQGREPVSPVPTPCHETPPRAVTWGSPLRVKDLLWSLVALVPPPALAVTP